MNYQILAVKAAASFRTVVKMTQETADITLAAFVTGSNLLFYGPPGTGKTLSSETFGKLFAGGNLATENVQHKKVKKTAPNGQVSLFDQFANEATGEVAEGNEGLVSMMAQASNPQVIQKKTDGYTTVYSLKRFDAGTQIEQFVGNLSLPELMKGKEVPVFRPELQSAISHNDEINRATPPITSVLMEHMGESRASIGHYQIKLPRKMFVSTMNPFGAGTFELDEALKDRKAVSVTPEFLTGEDLEDIGLGSSWSTDIEPIGTLEDLLAMWEESVTMPWEPDAKSMAAYMIRATTVCAFGNKAELIGFPACCQSMGGGKGCDYSGGTACCKEVTPLGARAHKSLEIMAAGYAYLRGDAKVTVKHLEVVAPYVIRHRAEILTENGTQQSLKRAKEMVKRMMDDARPVVTLLTDARKGKLKNKDVEAARGGKNLLVLEVLPRVERLIQTQFQATFANPTGMSVAELRKSADMAPDTIAKTFNEMLKAQAKVVGLIDPKNLSDPFFRASFKSGTGDTFLSEEAWDTLEATRKVESDELPGIKFSITKAPSGALLTIDFGGINSGGPECGEEFRMGLNVEPIKGFDPQSIYQGLTDLIRETFPSAAEPEKAAA